MKPRLVVRSVLRGAARAFGGLFPIRDHVGESQSFERKPWSRSDGLVNSNSRFRSAAEEWLSC